MTAETLIKEINEAFADIPWPYESPPRSLGLTGTEAVIDDIYLMSDMDKNYELPRAMCVAITQTEPQVQNRLLSKLVDFLDADFDDPERVDGHLKDVKLQTFSNYSTAQSLAIWSWLTFVKTSYELTGRQEELTSAIRFWSIQGQTKTGRGN